MADSRSRLPQLNPWTILKEQYRVEKKLGEGGFVAVYQTADTTTGERYAMKVEGVREDYKVIVLQALKKSGARHAYQLTRLPECRRELRPVHRPLRRSRPHPPQVRQGGRGTADAPGDFGIPRHRPLRLLPGPGQGEELGRKDDLKSWFYTLVELTTGRLPRAHLEMADRSPSASAAPPSSPRFSSTVTCWPSSPRPTTPSSPASSMWPWRRSVSRSRGGA